MKLLMVLVSTVILAGCASLEEQCDQAIFSGRTHYKTTSQCVAGEQQRQAAGLAAASKSWNDSQPSKPAGTDGVCMSQCAAGGYSGPYCQKQCSY